MVTFASKIFKKPLQRLFSLYLFCMIAIVISGSTTVQKSASAGLFLQLPTSSTIQTATTDERIKRLEEHTQKLSESISRLPLRATLIGSIMGSIVALIGNWLLHLTRKEEITVSRVQTISSFLPQLQSKYLEDVELAIKLVVALGDVELATDLLKRYETGVAIPIFQKLVSSPNPKIAQQVEQSLKDYLKRLNLAEARERILSLVRQYAQINEKEEFSFERTWKMESIISEIRRYALVAFPLLPELTSNFCPSEDIVNSLVDKMKINTVLDYPLLPELEKPADSRDWSTDGKRLAAVAILQVQPNSDYLDWLATILAREEGSFLGYHAAIALRNAVYSLGKIHYAELQRATEFARKKALEIHGKDIKDVLDKPPFREVLTQAEAALQRYLN